MEWSSGGSSSAPPTIGENPSSGDHGRSTFGSAELIQQCIPWGVLVVDQQRRILFANPRARSFLQAKNGLREQDGKLRVERTSIDRGLDKLICRVAAGNYPAATQDTVGVPDRQGQIRYALKVARCRTESEEVAALLVISDLVSAARMSRASVAQVFRLTEREAEFAELFASGLCIATIADQMGISAHTARVHLRHVLAKTGCASQIELARRFAYMP